MHAQIPALESLLLHEMTKTAEFKIIVFFNTARTAGFMAQLFHAAGYPVLEMHSRKTQTYRTHVAAEFSKGQNNILFTSDVSARGVGKPTSDLISVAREDSRSEMRGASGSE